MNEVKAFKLSWEEISQKIQPEIEAILGRRFPEGRIPLSELFKILEAVHASEQERIDSVPPESDNAVDVSCLGMSASELLLRRCLGYQWETMHIEDDALWILGEKDGDLNEA